MKQLLQEILQVKELTAVLTLFFGLGLSLAGFIVDPMGVVDDSVLWILGQTLIYAGSVFGVSTHYAAKQKELEDSIDKRFNKLQNKNIE